MSYVDKELLAETEELIQVLLLTAGKLSAHAHQLREATEESKQEDQDDAAD